MFIMKTILTLQVFWLLLHIHTIRGAVKWILDTNPIVFGNNVTIICIVPERTCPKTYVRRWFGGPHQTLLCLNYRSNNLTKYNMFALKNSESFGLIIYNLDESDVECNYTCSCGFDQFTKKLSFRENKLIYPMDRWITKQTTTYNIQNLSLNFSIEKVYPMPKCRLKLNDLIIVANMKFMKDNTNNWLLAKVTYSDTLKLNTNQSLCDSEIKVECWNDFIENFSVVIQTILHNAGCCESVLLCFDEK